MAGLAAEAIRNAVAAALQADGTVTAIGDVYQRAPDGTSLPYITLDGDTEILEDTFGRSGRMLMVNVNCWSDKVGQDECHRLADAAVSVLDWATLTVTGWTFVSCNLESMNEVLTEDYRQIVVRVRVRVHA